MDRRIAGFALLGVIVVGGCSGRPEIPYAEWMRTARTSDSASGRYELYAKAANMAETAAPKYLTTVAFTPGKRDLCLKQIGPALKTLSQGSTRAELGFRFTPERPFEQANNVAGWRLLGRGLVWKIERAVKERDYDVAVSCTKLATRFGLDLLGGGALEASLGMVIADEARRAIAPALPRMSPKQLTALSEGITQCFERMPEIAQTIDNERMNMLAGVQALQDAYRAEEWTKLVKLMGPDVRAAVDRLKQMKSEDPSGAVTFFKGLADEAEEEARYADKLAAVPTIDRMDVPEPLLNGSRPWRRFARHFIGTLRPLLKQHDATLARTRLLIVETRLQQVARTQKPYPKSLVAWGKDIMTDPYTGEGFVYRADGGDCRVYSVGADLSDDGGQTDDSFSAPDLRLEIR